MSTSSFYTFTTLFLFLGVKKKAVYVPPLLTTLSELACSLRPVAELVTVPSFESVNGYVYFREALTPKVQKYINFSALFLLPPEQNCINLALYFHAVLQVNILCHNKLNIFKKASLVERGH